MNNEEIEGRLQRLEVNTQAILHRLDRIESQLNPGEAVPDLAAQPVNAFEATTVQPIATEAASVVDKPSEIIAGPPPVIEDLKPEPSPKFTSSNIPDYVRRNMSAEQLQASSPYAARPPEPPRPPAEKFTLPTPPSADDIEYKFGINGLLRGGAVVFVLALLFLVAIMVGRGAITPPVQFAGEVSLCLAFIGFGIWKRNEREDFGQLMVGIGSFGLYASFAGGYAYKHLYEGEPLVAMYTLLSLANLGFASWRSSKSFLCIGMLGGLVAAMMPMQKDKVLLDFALHFLILVPCAAIIIRNKWNGMAGLMWVISTAALIPATTSNFEQFWRVGATYLNCAIALFACGKVFKPSEFDKHAAIQTIMLVLTGFFAIAIDTGHKGSLHAIVLTAIAAGVGYVLRENEKARNATWLGGLIVFSIITPIGFTQNVAAFAYGIEALALILVAIRYKLVSVWAVSLATFLFSLVAYLYFPDKNIVSLARFSPPLELLLIAISSVTVALNIRYALPNKSKEIQSGAMFCGGMLLVAFFVRALNVILGNGNTSLHIGAINTLALSLASIAVLVLANRFQRLAIYVLGTLTATTSFLFYMVADPDGKFSFIRVSPGLDLTLLALFSVSAVLSVRFALCREDKNFQEIALFVGGSLLVAFFVRGMNIVLGNGNTSLEVNDINMVGIGISGLAMTLVGTLSKRTGILAASAILTLAVGLVAILSEPETTPHWMSPIMVALAAGCVLAGTRHLMENNEENTQEVVMVFAGLAMSAFFVRLMQLVGINHLLDLTKETSTYFSLGLLNAIWIAFVLRNRRPANLILGWTSFTVAAASGASLPFSTVPGWLSPVLLAIPIIALSVLYSTNPRKESDEMAITALCVIPGWFLSTLFLRQELLRPWIGLNNVASYTAAWVIFAVFLITVGFKAERRFLRYWALAVFAVTVAKVFLIDLAELDSVIRVAILTLVGLGMMGGGYWYILWRRGQTPKPTPPPGTDDES